MSIFSPRYRMGCLACFRDRFRLQSKVDIASNFSKANGLDKVYSKFTRRWTPQPLHVLAPGPERDVAEMFESNML